MTKKTVSVGLVNTSWWSELMYLPVLNNHLQAVVTAARENPSSSPSTAIDWTPNMKVFYCDTFSFPLPAGHRFPIQKYVLLRQAVMAAGLVSPDDLIIPEPATDEQILRAHDVAYLRGLESGQLTPKEMRPIGLPWSPELVARSRCSVGGTIAACRTALRDGVAVSLAGGTHHAFRDRGQGFCVFNDSAIAARTMQAEGRVGRVVIVDCDVHQGNGTAAILADDPTIFTFSIHAARNFPFRKERSDLDIELEDGTGDEGYLAALEAGVKQALEQAAADVAIYLAGADPYEGDRLGRLSLSKAGLARRDRLVFELCGQWRLPVACVMAGGYGRQIQDTVDIHLETVRIAAEMASAGSTGSHSDAAAYSGPSSSESSTST